MSTVPLKKEIKNHDELVTQSNDKELSQFFIIKVLNHLI